GVPAEEGKRNGTEPGHQGEPAAAAEVGGDKGVGGQGVAERFFHHPAGLVRLDGSRLGHKGDSSFLIDTQTTHFAPVRAGGAGLDTEESSARPGQALPLRRKKRGGRPPPAPHRYKGSGAQGEIRPG